MSVSNKQKLLLVFLLVVTIILFTTYYKYPWHPDHYTLGQYTNALIEKGYAPWVLHPISLFGYYPLSIPSGLEYFFAVLHNLTSLDLPILFYMFSVFSALFAVAGVYLLMREFSSFETSFLTAFILATMVYFVKNVSNTASSRMFNIIFYPLFILVLFKLFKTYKEEHKISIKYIITAILLFVFMNLIHRFGQILMIFVIAFFLALIFINFDNMLNWIKSKKLYSFRKKYYNYSPLLAYIDVAVIGLILLSFSLIKIKLIWINLSFLILIHYAWFDYFKVLHRKRSENLLLLDLFLFGSYTIFAKILDLAFRGRFLINFFSIIEKYSFQLTILGLASTLLLIVGIFIIHKQFKGIRNFSTFVKSKTFEILYAKPERLISWALLLVMLFFISKNFTGDNFYKFGLSYYTKSFLLEGNSPWVIMINFIFNLNNNLTILIYFAIFGVIYLFLKQNKTFYDYFLVFVALGFSQFLLDWEYVRLYMLPIYAIFIGLGLVFIIKKLSVKFSRKKLHSMLVVIFLIHLVIGNVFIQREYILPKLGFDEDLKPKVEQFYITAGSYLKDKGEVSILSSSDLHDDNRVAYYAGKANSVIAQSVFTKNRDFEIERITFDKIWDSFNRGTKVTQIYNLKDPIYGSNYYFGRYIYNLNKRNIHSKNVDEIIRLYNIRYVVDSPYSIQKTQFFTSIQPTKNKVYSSGKLDLYDLGEIKNED